MKNNKTTTSKGKDVKAKPTATVADAKKVKPANDGQQVCSSCGIPATHIVFNGEASVHTCINHITDYTTADNLVIITNVRRTV